MNAASRPRTARCPRRGRTAAIQTRRPTPAGPDRPGGASAQGSELGARRCMRKAVRTSSSTSGVQDALDGRSSLTTSPRVIFGASPGVHPGRGRASTPRTLEQLNLVALARGWPMSTRAQLVRASTAARRGSQITRRSRPRRRRPRRARAHRAGRADHPARIGLARLDQRGAPPAGHAGLGIDRGGHDRRADDPEHLTAGDRAAASSGLGLEHLVGSGRLLVAALLAEDREGERHRGRRRRPDEHRQHRRRGRGSDAEGFQGAGEIAPAGEPRAPGASRAQAATARPTGRIARSDRAVRAAVRAEPAPPEPPVVPPVPPEPPVGLSSRRAGARDAATALPPFGP